MVLFDSTTLLLLLHPLTSAPLDRNTGKPVSDSQKRIDHLVKLLDKQGSKIIIPTPALSEILVRAEKAGPDYLAKLTSSAVFKIVAFDIRAAVEVAAMTRADILAGDKKGGSEKTWTQIKYDRQIVAIAKVEQVTDIYTDDEGVAKFARKKGINVIGIGDLPLPPEDPQTKMAFSENK